MDLDFDTIEGIERARERKSAMLPWPPTSVSRASSATSILSRLAPEDTSARETEEPSPKIAGERKVKEVLSNCSKQALLGSKAIYNARNSPDWS